MFEQVIISEKELSSFLCVLKTALSVEFKKPYPALEVIRRALEENRAKARHMLLAIFFESCDDNPHFAANLLTSIGQLQAKEAQLWGNAMALHGLRNKDTKVRIASVKAFEQWHDAAGAAVIRQLLETKQEKNPAVLKDMKKAVRSILN